MTWSALFTFGRLVLSFARQNSSEQVQSPRMCVRAVSYYFPKYDLSRNKYEQVWNTIISYEGIGHANLR